MGIEEERNNVGAAPLREYLQDLQGEEVNHMTAIKRQADWLA